VHKRGPFSLAEVPMGHASMRRQRFDLFSRAIAPHRFDFVFPPDPVFSRNESKVHRKPRISHRLCGAAEIGWSSGA
jgi:hypothetical protein